MQNRKPSTHASWPGGKALCCVCDPRVVAREINLSQASLARLAVGGGHWLQRQDTLASTPACRPLLARLGAHLRRAWQIRWSDDPRPQGRVAEGSDEE
jgi:hypothetical protein